MNQMMRCIFLLLATRIALCAAAQELPLDRLAPDSTAVLRFELHDGALIIGRVMAIDADSIHVAGNGRSRHGLARADVARATRYDARTGSFERQWFAAPVPSRNLIGPTAIPMRRGEMRYTNTYFLFHSLTAGLTSRLSLGLGTEFTSFLSTGGAGALYFGSIKYGGKVADGVHVAAHGMMVSVPYDGWFYSSSERLNLGFAGGLVTLGDADRQLTAGLSWSVLRFRWVTRYPLVTVGGQWRFSKRLGFVTENMLLPLPGERSPYLLSYALRIMGRELAGDLGFFNNSGISQSIALGIPYASFTAKW